MPLITISLPSSDNTRVNNAFASAYNHDPTGGETKEAFAKRQIIEFIKGVVRGTEVNGAADNARKQAQNVHVDPNLT